MDGIVVHRKEVICQYKHKEKSGRVTIAGHLSDNLAPGTMNSIFKQAGFKE